MTDMPSVLVLHGLTFDIDPESNTKLPSSLTVAGLYRWMHLYATDGEQPFDSVDDMKILYSILKQAFVYVGLQTADCEKEAQFRGIVLGQEYRASRLQVVHILFLCWISRLQLFQRLPVTACATFSESISLHDALKELDLTWTLSRLG